MVGPARLPAGWMAQPRTEYGWPITMVRLFDEPSDQTAGGRFDTAGAVVNALCWAFVAAVCCMPVLAGRFRQVRGRLQAAKGELAARKAEAAHAKPAHAKSFREHLREQERGGI